MKSPLLKTYNYLNITRFLYIKHHKETKNILKNSKRSIAAILTLCILIDIAGTCVYAASIPEENTVPTEETIQELMPIMASECTIYTSKSIPISGNNPNSTYYWTSGGQPGGTIFSIAQTNSYGQTIWRQDLVPYNGMPLHHDNIYGPHQHNYTWSSYINSVGEIFWNFIDDIFSLGG